MVSMNEKSIKSTFDLLKDHCTKLFGTKFGDILLNVTMLVDHLMTLGFLFLAENFGLKKMALQNISHTYFKYPDYRFLTLFKIHL